MLWKKVENLKKSIVLPGNILVSSLKPKEVVWLIHSLKEWYPGIHVGNESKFIESATYRKECFLRKGQERNPYYPIVFHSNGNPVGVMVLAKEDRSLRISGITGAVNPLHRGLGFASAGPYLVETLGRAIGAELAYYYGSLQFPQTQIAAEKMGFSLVGILPAFELDIRKGRHGNIRTGRVTEAMYAKVLVKRSRLILPNLSSLTPKTQKVWTAIFGKSPSD